MQSEISQKAKDIAEEIKRRTAMNCWKLHIRPDIKTGICDSKIGGLPYWEPSFAYPMDCRGEKLILLAQLNLEQLRTDRPLPRKGILQFFVGSDDLYGMDFVEVR